MKTIRTSFNKHKSKFLFLFILFIFGMVTGILFYFKQDVTLRDELVHSLEGLFQNNVFPIKNIFYHFLLLLLLCFTIFCFLALPIFVCYIFFEGLSIGFIVPIFLSLFKINAALYFLLYFVLVKLVYLVFLFLFFVKILSFTKTYIVCLKNKNYSFLANLKYILLFVGLILVNDLFVYFVSNRILIKAIA